MVVNNSSMAAMATNRVVQVVLLMSRDIVQVVLVSNYTQTLDVCEQLCRSRGLVTQ